MVDELGERGVRELGGIGGYGTVFFSLLNGMVLDVTGKVLEGRFCL